jgi:hypothetical protein
MRASRGAGALHGVLDHVQQMHSVGLQQRRSAVESAPT